MREALTGTGLLLRLALRRDRFTLPIWTIAIAVFVPYFYQALVRTSGDDLQATIDGMSAAQGMLDIFAGPVYGLDAVTFPRYFMMYTQEFVLAAGLMNILLLVRHTRGEEQSGRAELVRTAAIGRHAPLTAALGVALITDTVLAALLVLGTLLIGFPFLGALLFGIGVAVTGLFFAGVTALTAQLAEQARTAGGIAGIALGAASIGRGAAAAQGADNPALWFAPAAWPNLTRPLTDPTWLPVLLAFVCTAGLAGVAYSISTRRDVGAGILRPGLGRVRAGRLLAGPLSLALRLQRSMIAWWLLAMAALGLVWGSLVGSIEGQGDLTNLFGTDLEAGYLSLLGVTQVLLIAVFALLSLARMKQEETSGRLDAALSTAIGRIRWIGSWVLVTALAVAALLLVSGWALGTGADAAIGAHTYTLTMIGAVFTRWPEVLALIGLSAALYGLSPRLQPLAWIVFGYGAIVRFFGLALDLPEAAQRLSLFQQIPRRPQQEFALGPIVALSIATLVLTAISLLAFNRRNV